MRAGWHGLFAAGSLGSRLLDRLAGGLTGDLRAPQSAVHVSADHAGTGERTEPWTQFMKLKEGVSRDEAMRLILSDACFMKVNGSN